MVYPTMLYAEDGRTTIIASAAEENALVGAWFDSPADFGLVTAPSAEEQASLTTTFSTGVMAGVANATSYATNGILMHDAGGNP